MKNEANTSFRMECDVGPQTTKSFPFSSVYLEKQIPPDDIKCPMCACGACQCEKKLCSDDDEDSTEFTDRPQTVTESSGKLTMKSLKDLYLNFIGDQKEWNKFVLTSKLVDRKNKNEINIFATLPLTETTDAEYIQRFTDFERLAICGILMELVEQLVILGVNKPKVVPQLSFHPPKVRYHAKIRKRMYDTDMNVLISGGEGHRDECRFQKLRTLLENIVKITGHEVNERSISDALQGFLWLEEKKLLEEKAIKNNYTDSVILIQTLKKILIRNEKDTQKAISDYETMKLHLKKELQQEIFKYGIYLSYFKDWAEAEFESEKWDKDLHYSQWIEKELNKCERMCNTENRVHRDVVVFLKLSMKKLGKDANKWTAKYDKDIEEKDVEISTMKQKRKDIHKTMSGIVAVFEQRQIDIQKFLRERAERQRKAEEEKRYNEAATKIQAWWRGTMVRWEFGKYDQDKSRKKKVKAKASKGRK